VTAPHTHLAVLSQHDSREGEMTGNISRRCLGRRQCDTRGDMSLKLGFGEE